MKDRELTGTTSQKIQKKKIFKNEKPLSSGGMKGMGNISYPGCITKVGTNKQDDERLKLTWLRRPKVL